ncbi:MAG: hypothetical protein JW854_15515 [Actinobacteria bacterium]|nr:hypothetical protein [Actinomycetota bacterium]
MSGQRKLLIILLLVPVLAMVVLAGCGQGGQSRTVGVDWERVPDETASLFA